MRNSSSEYILRMMTPVRGFAFVICDAASIPLSRGMAMSISTTCGCNSPARRTASRPSSASAAISMPGSRSSRKRTPLRTMPWSSATSTRIMRQPFWGGVVSREEKLRGLERNRYLTVPRVLARAPEFRADRGHGALWRDRIPLHHL